MENVIRKAEDAQAGPQGKNALRAKVDELTNISTIPTVITRIMELTGNPNTVNHDLAKVIERDQSIAMRVVSASNSAFYGFSKKITTLSQAILVIGFDMVRGLALTTSVFNTVPARHKPLLKELWAHSFRTAEAAAMLAGKTGAIEKESAFLAGLFHDIGRAIILQVSEKGSTDANPFDRNLAEERKIFGATHAEAGAWLAEKYQLPETVVNAIRYHHEPEKCLSPVHPLVTVTYLANLAASIGPNSLASSEHASLAASLGMTPEDLESVASEISKLKGTSFSYYE